MIKCDEGDVPDREQFLAKHPAMRERLSELLAAADWIEHLAGPTVADVAAIAAPKPNPITDETLPLQSTRPKVADPNDVTLPVKPKLSRSIFLIANRRTACRASDL